VETGTFHGWTTRLFAETGLPVYTIEVLQKNYEISKEALRDYPNVTCIHGNSAIELKQLFATLPDTPTLFYLDAHWEHYWPLREELALIYQNCEKSVVIIDDFETPGRDFQFDSYGEHRCGMDYINDLLPNTCTSYYLDRTQRQQRGVGKLYIVHDNGEGLFRVENGVKYSNV
jgi:hypothetical protein